MFANPTLVLLLVYLAALVICVKLGNKKGERALGWITGLLLGWIGVVIMLLVRKTHDQEVADAARRMEIEAEARGEVAAEVRRPGVVAAYREAKGA